MASNPYLKAQRVNIPSVSGTSMHHGKADTIKKTGKFEGKSNKLGGGGRFKQLEAQGKSPALAAYIGRKKYGAKKMGKLSAKGRARAAKK